MFVFMKINNKINIINIMDHNKILKISKTAFFVGLVGDILLQLITHLRGNFAGLKHYFYTHGKLESLFIASGIMFLFMYIYLSVGLPYSIIYLFIYGALLDLLFRYGNLFPSLEEYYKVMSVRNSALWGGLPFLFVYYADNYINKIR